LVLVVRLVKVFVPSLIQVDSAMSIFINLYLTIPELCLSLQLGHFRAIVLVVGADRVNGYQTLNFPHALVFATLPKRVLLKRHATVRQRIRLWTWHGITSVAKDVTEAVCLGLKVTVRLVWIVHTWAVVILVRKAVSINVLEGFLDPLSVRFGVGGSVPTVGAAAHSCVPR